MTRTPTPRKEVASPFTLLDEAALDSLVSEVKSVLKKELTVLKDVEFWIPTGIPQLDLALGGGVPAGRMTTLIGKKSVGKSTLTIQLLAQIQKASGIAVGLDVERSNLKTRCMKQGIDMRRYIPSQPESLDTFERENLETGKKEKVKGAFDIIEDLLRVILKKSPKALVGIVLDSIAGSAVAQEKEGDVGDATYGAHSRILSQAFRMIMPAIHDNNICLILVNQTKKNVGVMYGPQDTYIGKNPIDFHSAITLEMTSGGPFPKESKNPEGIITKVYVSKNKVAPPFASIEYVTFFDRGIDTLWESIDFMKANGLLGTTAGYYEWDSKKHRQKQLYNLAKSDPGLGEIFIRMAKEVVNEKLTYSKIEVDDPGSEVPEAVAA